MRVLFVSSGNSDYGISPVVKSQGESLKNEGIHVYYFTIREKGLKGYFKYIILLRKHINHNFYDIVHAHYSLSAFVATIAGCKPLIVSLMGSDIRSGFFLKSALKIFSLLFWEATIVKSKDMLDRIGITSAKIIANGVNVTLFCPKDKISAQKILGWDTFKKHILFAANPSRSEKNFCLFQKAYHLLGSKDYVQTHLLKNILHYDIQKFMNASDVVVLTSLWEGSPNVIKEAMACNRPIICTNVGDVSLVFGNTLGCYLISFDPKDVVSKLTMALSFSEKHDKTNGRRRIFELGLDSKTVANRIINIYQSILNSVSLKNFKTKSMVKKLLLR